MSDLAAPRWRGAPGRMEAWYGTWTARSGTGLWLHHEVVAPPRGPAHAHGWAAVFPVDAPPTVHRFGPAPLAAGDVPPPGATRWFDAAGCTVGEGGLHGRAGEVSWSMACRPTSPPLATFPRWAWDHDVLPSAQVVPWPTTQVTGQVHVGDQEVDLDGARGALAHIHGQGNAHEWGWLHADLGGGDVLEVVAARGRHRLLRPVPPRAIVRLRLDGQDWPADPLVAALASRVTLGLPDWAVTVTTPTRRLRVRVHVPQRAAVTLEYEDPDGARSWCTNSCRADAEVEVQVRRGIAWGPARRWQLRGRAHAEVGRPAA